MGFTYADVKTGGRFDIDAEGKVSRPRFVVHRRLVDEATGADAPETGVREVEVSATPEEFDALFAHSVAVLEADNRARHEQVAQLQQEKAEAAAEIGELRRLSKVASDRSADTAAAPSAE